MPFRDDIYAVADDLRAVANQGLHYDRDPHARERYEKVLNASAQLLAGLEQLRPAVDLSQRSKSVPTADSIGKLLAILLAPTSGGMARGRSDYSKRPLTCGCSVGLTGFEPATP